MSNKLYNKLWAHYGKLDHWWDSHLILPTTFHRKSTEFKKLYYEFKKIADAKGKNFLFIESLPNQTDEL